MAIIFNVIANVPWLVCDVPIEFDSCKYQYGGNYVETFLHIFSFDICQINFCSREQSFWSALYTHTPSSHICNFVTHASALIRKYPFLVCLFYFWNVSFSLTDPTCLWLEIDSLISSITFFWNTYSWFQWMSWRQHWTNQITNWLYWKRKTMLKLR